MRVSASGFALMLRGFSAACRGRVACVLEGGYQPSILAEHVCSIIKVLTNYPSSGGSDDTIEDMISLVPAATAPRPGTLDMLRRVIEHHRGIGRFRVFRQLAMLHAPNPDPGLAPGPRPSPAASTPHQTPSDPQAASGPKAV